MSGTSSFAKDFLDVLVHLHCKIIFLLLESNLKPDWVLELEECLAIDRAMNNIMCQCRSDELVRNVMRAGHAEKSQRHEHEQ